MLREFLTDRDAERTLLTLRKIARHGIYGIDGLCATGRWALTGGVAIEIHNRIAGGPRRIRPLNDLDFVADAFESIAPGLAEDFLVMHVHRGVEPGKIMLQLADADAGLRIDVFRACPSTLARATTTRDLGLDLAAAALRLVAVPDLIARTARLALDLLDGVPIPAKHAADYLRLSGMVKPQDVQSAWEDHRKATQPESFEEADRLLRDLIPARAAQLTGTQYGTDVETVCPRCRPTMAFQLADRREVMSVLGYC
jgi:hypothetical protein